MATPCLKFCFLGLFISLFLNLPIHASVIKLSSAVGDCGIPSEFWCDNKNTASRCGVLEQCIENVWNKNTDKVSLALYYESLCPDCERTWASQLLPNYAKLSSILNLTLVPYGNAREKKQGDHWEFQCQHGPPECLGNLIETCAIALIKDVNKYVPFLGCMEEAMTSFIVAPSPVNAARKCADSTVPLDDILKCSQSDMGNKLLHEMAVKTDALKPSHTYVPWFTLNGVHTEKIQKAAETNLVKLVCDTYKGSSKPSICD